MHTAAPYRKVTLGAAEVSLKTDQEGRMHLESAMPLAPYPARITDRLHHWAQVCPERTFIARRDAAGAWIRISYREALEQAQRIGQALLERGLSAQRPILILSENDLEHAMLALAALYAGIPYTVVSPAYSLVSQDFEKLHHVVGLLTPGLVFASHGQSYERAIEAVLPADTEVVVTHAPPLQRAATLFSALSATAIGAAVRAAHDAVGPDTIAKFLFTSGSTSMPKAVINTQRMLCSNQQMILQCMPFIGEEPPVLVDWLPWNHTFGGNHNYGLTLYNGGTLYIDDGKPTAAGIAETIRNLREIAPTIYFNVPTGFEQVVLALRADDGLRKNFFSRLKMMFYAGASLSQPVWDGLHELAVETCGERIVMITGLGMTETAPFALCAHWEAGRSGGIGLPAPSLTLRLVPDGDKLEARYKGPSVTPGFWRAAQQTSAAFDEDGFYRSGDAVRFIDADAPHRGLLFDGRIAEDFKLATGTWVSVGPLRAKVMAAGAPYVFDVVIAGHDRSEVGILIFPQLDACRALAPHLPARADAAELLRSAGVRAYFQRLANTLNVQSTGSANRVMRALLLEKPPSLESGEVTDKGSINQRAVLKQRAVLVEELFAAEPGERVLVCGPNAHAG